MSGTTGDVLTQARTPTDSEIRAAFFEESGVGASAAVLKLAAPRILALAYREAARLQNEVYDDFEAQTINSQSKRAANIVVQIYADKLRALATALEEGTPND